MCEIPLEIKTLSNIEPASFIRIFFEWYNTARIDG